MTALIELVKSPEGGVAFFAHVALEDGRISLAQIDNHQAIDHVGKFAIEVEAYKTAAQFHVLLDEDGYAFAVFFHIRDRLSEFVEIASQAAQGAAIPAAKHGRPEWSSGMDQVRELSAVLVLALLEVANDHFAGERTVFVADADGAEEHRIFRMHGNETRDAFPQLKQRSVLALILEAYEGAAEFKRGTDLQEQPLVVAEHGICVESLDAAVADDFVRVADAISAGQLLFLFVPQQQMPVVGIEVIEVEAAAGAFADGAESHFAETAEFVERMRQLGRTRCVDGEFAVCDQQTFRC